MTTHQPTRTSLIRKTHFLGTCCGVIATLLTNSALANWMIEPSVELSASYTDNARLRDDGDDDFIISGTAAVDINNSSARSETYFNGRVSYDQYTQGVGSDGYRLQFGGANRFQVVEDKLILDTRASMTERTIFRGSARPAFDRTTEDDRTRIFTYSVGPEFRQQIGSSTELNAKASVSGTSFDEADTGNALFAPDDEMTYDAQVSIGSVPDKPGLGWQLSGLYIEDDDDFTRSTVQGILRFPFTNKITPYVRVGHDDIESPSIDDSERSGEFYFGGVILQPGPRLNIDVAVGERFGDTSASASATYLFSEELSLNVIYDETVKTQQQGIQDALRSLQFSDTGTLITDIGSSAELDSLLLDLVNIAYKENNLRVGLNGAFGRNAIALNGRYIQREFDGDNTEEEIMGVDGEITRNLTNKIDAFVGFGYGETLESRFPGLEESNYTINIGATLNLNETLSTTASYGHYSREHDTLDDITENAFTVVVRKTF